MKEQTELPYLKGVLINEDEVEKYRNLGYRLHHAEEYQPYHFEDDEPEQVIIRDDWFAASPEWVEEYHQDGGIWAYKD